jgi:recombination protein RecR
MKSAQPFEALTASLQSLPGIGPKTALRLASHLLQHDRPAAQLLAHSLSTALGSLRNCCRCNSFTDQAANAAGQVVCLTCGDASRDASLLCVVESVADQLTIEQSLSYKGLYFVLMGRLSPLDGMGAGDIALEALLARAGEPQVAEVILANRFSADGEATAHVIAKHIRQMDGAAKKVTRLAKGVPVGVELEYVDLPTLAHALRERRAQ